MDKYTALRNLVAITNKNIGFTPKTPSDFFILCEMIKEKTNSQISISSLKRIWGYVNYKGYPYATTLDILSKFNNYRDWERFLKELENLPDENASEYIKEKLVNPESLVPGDRIAISWSSNKGCLIEFIEENRFRILESENIKLKPEDTFRLHSICIGLPFYATDIKRGELTLAGYIGAKAEGVQSIKVISGSVGISD